LGDTGGVFDELRFNSADEAETALRRNGFARFEEDAKAGEFLSPPRPLFWKAVHPSGPIYSSGSFWI
jgi:hypothetical protein